MSTPAEENENAAPSWARRLVTKYRQAIGAGLGTTWRGLRILGLATAIQSRRIVFHLRLWCRRTLLTSKPSVRFLSAKRLVTSVRYNWRWIIPAAAGTIALLLLLVFNLSGILNEKTDSFPQNVVESDVVPQSQPASDAVDAPHVTETPKDENLDVEPVLVALSDQNDQQDQNKSDLLPDPPPLVSLPADTEPVLASTDPFAEPASQPEMKPENEIAFKKVMPELQIETEAAPAPPAERPLRLLPDPAPAETKAEGMAGEGAPRLPAPIRIIQSPEAEAPKTSETQPAPEPAEPIDVPVPSFETVLIEPLFALSPQTPPNPKPVEPVDPPTPPFETVPIEPLFASSPEIPSAPKPAEPADSPVPTFETVPIEPLFASSPPERPAPKEAELISDDGWKPSDPSRYRAVPPSMMQPLTPTDDVLAKRVDHESDSKQIVATARHQTSVHAPRLRLELKSPEGTRVGELCAIEFTIENTGVVDAEHVLLHVDLPSELSYAYGRMLKYDVGTLHAGQTHSARLTARAEQSGQPVIHARVLLEKKPLDVASNTLRVHK